MYKINRDLNEVEKLQECSFGELGFKEKENLQEWIAKEPAIRGEALLIIQKEFSGFSDTQERLDLLALDKDGSLVVIENKLDDTGKDVTWQALKYASYCSKLSKENIRKIYQDYLDGMDSKYKAEDKLSEFFEAMDYEDLNLNQGITQRVILIAAKFRKEVTSTVLWLLNFQIQLQCFRATPYSMKDKLFLNVEQIIPTQDAEDYMIGMAEKAQDDIGSRTERKQRDTLREEFWTTLLQRINAKSNLYQNISSSTRHSIGAGSGVRGAGLNFVTSKSYGRAELYIDRGKGNGEENKFIFNELLEQKEKIEKDFGSPLIWEPLKESRACRIKAEASGNVFDREKWDEMQAFMVDSMLKLEKVMKKPLEQVNQKLKEMPHGNEESSD